MITQSDINNCTSWNNNKNQNNIIKLEENGFKAIKVVVWIAKLLFFLLKKKKKLCKSIHLITSY